MWPRHEKYARDRRKLAEKHSCNAIKGAHSFSLPCNIYLAALEPILCNLLGIQKKATSLFSELLCGKSTVPHSFLFPYKHLS